MFLDIHALLWFALADPQLSDPARAVIEAPLNDVLVSPASYWEIAIKVSIGKYHLTEPFEAFMERAIGGNDFAVLPITPAHAAGLIRLPFHHRDPFDRLLVAQAIIEKIPIVSADVAYDAYPVARIW